jgi:phosphohistidine phosphatase
MRHAEAVEGSDILQDEWRYLTEKGRGTAKAISASIAKYGPKPKFTVTSPLTRAVQTAEITAEKACRKNVVVANTLLLPDADVTELVAFLRAYKGAKPVMLVGHEPQLGSLIATLLGREEELISLKKSACVALEFNPDKEEKPSNFLWYLAPGKKRTTSVKKAFPQP